MKAVKQSQSQHLTHSRPSEAGDLGCAGVMRLHILGPAFGLPSIDPECTAAVALVKTYCEKEGKQWELVPSHETSTSDCLPLLEDGEVSIRGFGNIVKHLSGGKGSIPGWAASLSPEQEADQTA